MHLIVISNLYPPEVLGGYEILTQDVVARLRDRGHRVKVLTTGRQNPGEDGVARWLRLVRPFTEDPRRDRQRHLAAAGWNRAATRACLVRRGPFDAALIMSMRRLGVEPLRALAHSAVPTVLTVNDDWPAAYGSRLGGGWRARLGRHVDRGPWARHTFRGVPVGEVVYLSKSIREEVRAAVPGFPPGIVQAQGVDLGHFEEREFRPIRPQVNLLVVGRLHPTKAPDVAIDALAALRSRGVDARLSLAGAPVNPAYGEELKALCATRGVGDHVTWLGLVDRAELPRIYRDSDVMLFLNRWAEPQGLTYMEAMASGVPVVAHPLGGARELLENWQAAEMVPACTGEAFADGVSSLMSSVARQRSLTNTARAMLREAASLDQYVDALEERLELAASQGVRDRCVSNLEREVVR